jgi:hypothetical protein
MIVVGHGLETNGHPVSRLPTVEGLPLHVRARGVLTGHGVADPPPRAGEDLVAGAVDRLDGGEPPGIQGQNRGHNARQHVSLSRFMV